MVNCYDVTEDLSWKVYNQQPDLNEPNDRQLGEWESFKVFFYVNRHLQLWFTETLNIRLTDGEPLRMRGAAAAVWYSDSK